MNLKLIKICMISTHTPLAGRDPFVVAAFSGILISTHTPLAGRDVFIFAISEDFYNISTHTPLAGRDRYI